MALTRRTRIQATVVAAALIGNAGVAAVALAGSGSSSPGSGETVELALAADAAPARAAASASVAATAKKAPVARKAAPKRAVPATRAVPARPATATSPATRAVPATPATPARRPAPVPTTSAPAVAASSVLRGVRLDALTLVPSATQVVTAVSTCLDGLTDVIPVKTAPASAVPGFPVVGDLLGGLLGGLLPLAPVVPTASLPDPAKVTAAVRGCLAGVLDLVPDAAELTDALAPLSALTPTQLAGLGLGGLDVDGLLALVTRATQLATSGTPDPAQLLDLLTGVIGSGGSALAPLEAVLPLLGGLTDLPTGAGAAAPALQVVQQVLGSLAGLLPVGR